MASIFRNLIKMCEEIEFEDGIGTPSGRPMSSRSGRSGMSGMNSPLPPDDFDDGMGMDNMDDMPMGNDPLDMPMTDTDIDVESNGDGANITIATPKGTSVTVTEARRRKLRESRNRKSMRRPVSEAFFKTKADIENLYNGDDALTIHRKREESKWMNEAEEEEIQATEEVTMSSTSGKDGRHVSGTVSDANGKSYDIDGTLSFSGDDLLIDDVNLEAVSSDAPEEEVTEIETEETSETGLEKNPDMDITFEEKFGRKNESQSLIAKMKDPIGDMLNLRKSGTDVPPAPGKPHHSPVKRVHDNSLHNRKEIDIKKKGDPSQADTKAPRYQTKPATE